MVKQDLELGMGEVEGNWGHCMFLSVRIMVGLDNADSCDFEGRVILRIVKQSHELAMREIEGNRDIVCLHLGEGCGSP